MKTYLLFGTLGVALSTSAMACGGIILLDGEPSGSPDGGPSTPAPSTPAPSTSTSTPPPTTPSPVDCTSTPTTLATLPGHKAIGLSLGTGFVAVLAEITSKSPQQDVGAERDVQWVPIGSRQAPRILGPASPLSDAIEARDQRVYFAQGSGPNSTAIVEHDAATGKTRSVSPAVGPFAITGSDILVATPNTDSLPPPQQSTITAFTLGPTSIGPRTIATYAGETTSLSARGNEWGAVLADGRVAQGAGSGQPVLSAVRGARGPGRLTAAGASFAVHERLTCAEATCNHARVSYFPSPPSSGAQPVTTAYAEATFTTIQAFFADEKGAVFQAAVASGEEIRAREAIVTQAGPGGAFTTRVADIGRQATAIHADSSCIYWLETDASDPAPGAETVVVRMVKR